MPTTLRLLRLALRASAPVAIIAAAALCACSGNSNDENANSSDDGMTGGTSTGGASTGGATTGGSATGGSATGGAATGGSSGAGGGSDGCPDGCPGGTCFQGLDGTWACVTRPTDDHTDTCDPMQMDCCSADSECTDGLNGRCLSRQWMYNGCGGAVPFGNECYYDACTDADCPAVAGADVAACVPAGALGTTVSMCVNGGCRTNADCTTHPGGQCMIGEAQTHGQCTRHKVFFCAYPSDPCGTPDKQCSVPLVCLPEDSYDGRVCAEGPPQYP